MIKYNTIQRAIIKAGYLQQKHTDIAAELGKNPKSVSEWLRRHNLKKCPNYSEMEIYILLNFSIKNCAQMIKIITFTTTFYNFYTYNQQPNNYNNVELYNSYKKIKI